MSRYVLLAVIHRNDGDDAPFKGCIGTFSDMKEAEEFSRTLLKDLGSADLTDFALFAGDPNPSECKGCRMSDICNVEVDDEV